MGVEDAARKLFGLQYHPEVAHSERGRELLRHFLFDVAGVAADWRMEDVLKEEMDKVAKVVRAFPYLSPAAAFELRLPISLSLPIPIPLPLWGQISPPSSPHMST